MTWLNVSHVGLDPISRSSEESERNNYLCKTRYYFLMFALAGMTNNSVCAKNTFTKTENTAKPNHMFLES